MTSEMSDVLLLSLFYWGHSVVMLRIVLKRHNILYVFSSVYAVLSVIVGWKVHIKWTLAASLLFMLMAMSINLWIILKQSRECIRDLKQLREEEALMQSIHEEIPNGK